MTKCKVCGSEDFHAPNSYICKLISSPCKHEWGERFESKEDNCKICGHGYSISKCKKCEMDSALHWSEVFFHDEGECMKNFDKLHCPKCKLSTVMDRAQAHKLDMVCGNKKEDGTKCKYSYTDQEAEKCLGVRKVDTVDNENNPISAFENIGTGHLFYHSPYCLKGFTFLNHMKEHDKQYHKIGDKMACCIPSGFIVEMDQDHCGMENVISV